MRLSLTVFLGLGRAQNQLPSREDGRGRRRWGRRRTRLRLPRHTGRKSDTGLVWRAVVWAPTELMINRAVRVAGARRLLVCRQR